MVVGFGLGGGGRDDEEGAAVGDELGEGAGQTGGNGMELVEDDEAVVFYAGIVERVIGHLEVAGEGVAVEELFKEGVFVLAADDEEGNAGGDGEGEEEAVVESNRVVGGFDMALEKAVVLDGEGEGGSGGAVGGEVDGGDGLLAVADEEAQGLLFDGFVGEIAEAGIDFDSGSREVGRGVEGEAVEADVGELAAPEGDECGEDGTVGGELGEVGGGALEVADEVGVAVASGGREEELVLAGGCYGEGGCDGTGFDKVDGLQELFTAEPAELAAVHIVGKELEVGAGVVGGGNLTGFLLGSFDKAAFHATSFHAVGVVEVDADDGGSAFQGGLFGGNDGLAEGEDKADDGKDARGKDEEFAQIVLPTVLGLEFVEHVHVAEIDFAVAAQLQQMDNDGDGYCREAY